MGEEKQSVGGADRRQAAERLLGYGPFVQLLAENPLVGLYIWQGKRMTYANRRVCELTGYTPDELMRIPPIALVAPEDRAYMRRRTMPGVHEDVLLPREIRIVHKRGQIKYAHVAVQTLEWEGSELSCAMLTDMTEYRKTERQLLDSDERYRKLIRISPEPMVVHSEGMLIYVNQAAVALLDGQSERELLGRQLLDFFHPRQHGFIRDRLRKIKAGLMSDFAEVTLLTLNGSELEAEVSGVMITSFMDEPVIQTVLRNITERKAMENALKEAELKYRVLVEEGLVGVYMTQEGRIVYANPQLSELLGYAAGELEGIAVIELIADEDKGRYKSNCKRWLTGKRRPGDGESFEYVMLRKDGTHVFVEGRGSTIIYNGKAAVSGMVMDATERKKTEQFLRNSDKLSALGELAAGLAHEIRNPLTALRGFTQLMKARSGGNETYFELMLEELDRINLIVSEFMVLARPEVTHIEYKDVRKLLDTVVAVLGSQAVMSSVEIVTRYAAELPVVPCDEGQLKQVIVNVVKNAIEAMPEGGRLTVEAYADSASHVTVRFIDQGVGIPEDKLVRLGEPFYTTKEKGNGLGVMMCFKIMESHKGTMRFKSNPDKGITVELKLPTSETAEAL
ncbi:PAS domain S-box protein [Paenibacillus sp. IB182496]|uniref:histidine kinase n=1 Tax=Paenibacillus sabuli TaxID=2772509 RepID=A0A927GT98_9BACL|nr:PAS domain S-box protein [Paenibacillus sabuli]MBD2846870.1 PAS domain S-box protein [Paenibacillus sabuli]